MQKNVLSQKSDLTFRGNIGMSRHEWLRLTPAYSVKLVNHTLERWVEEAPKSIETILDPFSGTGTTALVAAQAGLKGLAIDINPFLVWLGTTKLREYSIKDIDLAEDYLNYATSWADTHLSDEGLWQPKLFKIDRWWDHASLSAIKSLRGALDQLEAGASQDLLLIAFCKTLISFSNAAFNHQSMSFKSSETLDRRDTAKSHNIISAFADFSHTIINQAKDPLTGSGNIFRGDSRNISNFFQDQVDGIITSPPYANRMSYIRELRPYMYWLRYLDDSKDAGELDWKTLGGTWGSATSGLKNWQQTEETPIDAELTKVCSKIVAMGEGKRGNTMMGKYVNKYFVDAWDHIHNMSKLVRPEGHVSYVVGNSTFYDVLVPTEKWYEIFLKEVGFKNVTVRPIRKRNSKKSLYEFEIYGTR